MIYEHRLTVAFIVKFPCPLFCHHVSVRLQYSDIGGTVHTILTGAESLQDPGPVRLNSKLVGWLQPPGDFMHT